MPLAVGAASPEEVAEVLELLWGGDETLIVISTDLSHYHDFETAKRRDAATAAAIEALDEGAIGPDDACGCVPLSGLLAAARSRGMTVQQVDLRNSGETAGRRRRVVGYGAFVARLESVLFKRHSNALSSGGLADQHSMQPLACINCMNAASIG